MSNKKKIQGHNTALESLKNILAVPTEKHGMYVWRKFTAQGGTFIDFVVSDIESAYPDGGLKDGYWYEKVTVGTYKTTSGSITLTEASQSIEIGHGLSETPKAYLITMTSQPSTTTSTNFSAYPSNYRGTTAQDVTLVGNGSAFRRTTNTIDDKTITIKSYNSEHSFKAGTYDWMAMA